MTTDTEIFKKRRNLLIAKRNFSKNIKLLKVFSKSKFEFKKALNKKDF